MELLINPARKDWPRLCLRPSSDNPEVVKRVNSIIERVRKDGDLALKQIADADKSKIVMIGDRKFDILGARENGIDSIGVLYGYGSRAELEEAQATFIVEKPEDLLIAALELAE